MTAKKYNKMHRVLDLDARDARRREESVARSAIKAADAINDHRHHGSPTPRVLVTPIS